MDITLIVNIKTWEKFSNYSLKDVNQVFNGSDSAKNPLTIMTEMVGCRDFGKVDGVPGLDPALLCTLH